MSKSGQALGQRIKELRRRHFGARGKPRLAELLGVPVSEYEKFERGTIPSGELLVRLCEVTGEDLQWLLTGVAGRGAVVISGTRGRHQALLARLAQLLDELPHLAAPIEAFVDLLARSDALRTEEPPALPHSPVCGLIPLYRRENAPRYIDAGQPDSPDPYALAHYADELAQAPRRPAMLAEPAMHYPPENVRAVELVELPAGVTDALVCLESVELARSFPGLLGVVHAGDHMRPMFEDGQTLLAMPTATARVGRPAVYRLDDEDAPRCGIWLGRDDRTISVGQLADHTLSQIAADKLSWALEVLFRLAPAA